MDDAHGVRVGQRLAHLVQVEECLKEGGVGAVRGVSAGTGAGAWRRGEDLLVGEVRALADLPIDRAAQVAELHVPGSDTHEGRVAGRSCADNALHDYIHGFAFWVKVDKFNLQGSAEAARERERRQATG